METNPRSPAFVGSMEAIEARAWASLPVISATEPLLDDNGVVAATALLADDSYPLANRVIGLGLERPVSGSLLDRVCEIYDARGNDAVFIPLAPTARPPTLPRLLKERGFELAAKEAKLYRTTQDPPAMDPHDEVIKADVGDHDLVLSLYRNGGMQADWAEVMVGNLGKPGWHHYIARDQGRPVAVGSMFAGDGFAMFFSGWALAKYRHRGYQRALTSHRITAAGELGCNWVGVNIFVEDEPLNQNLRSYTRLGFELLYVRTTQIRHRPGVSQTDASRRRMLVHS